MNAIAISTLVALGGSSIGAFAPVLSNYVLQRSVTRRKVMKRVVRYKQTFYSDFISQAARLYADSVTQDAFDMHELVGLYAMVNRMRLIAPDDVVVAAEEITKIIVQRYGEANIAPEEFRAMALNSNKDPLHAFSIACRKDLRTLVSF